jgi:hypothetical protein
MDPKFEGVTLKFGEDEFVIPPLNLGQVKRLLPTIEKMQNGTDTIEKFNAVVAVAHAALSRNYPDLKLEQVEEMVDLGNLKKIIDAVMGLSGFLPGEARPGSAQTGT